MSYGEHPYTCVNCAKQLRELNDTLRHREKGSLGGTQDRIGIQGFNQRYARSLEMESALEMEKDQRKEAERNSDSDRMGKKFDGFMLELRRGETNCLPNSSL